MSRERDHASVRSSSAIASATRSVGVLALSRPTKTCTGCARAASPMTVGMERSGGTRPSGRGRGSATGSGRTKVTAWRRPSRPSDSHATRLAGSPLMVGAVHSARCGPHPRVDRRRAGLDALHDPGPQRGHRDAGRGDEDPVREELPREPDPGKVARREPADLLGGPALHLARAVEQAEHGSPCGESLDGRGLGLVVESRIGRLMSGALDHGGRHEADGDLERESRQAASGAEGPVEPAHPGCGTDEHRAAEGRRSQPPASLADEAGPGGRHAAPVEPGREAQPRRGGCELARQCRGGPATVRGPRGRKERRGGDDAGDHVEEVLGRHGEQVVRPRREAGDDALVLPGAGRQRGRERRLGGARGHDEADPPSGPSEVRLLHECSRPTIRS